MRPACLLLVLASACRPHGPGLGGGGADAGPFATELRCPVPGPLPFVLDDTTWRIPDDANNVTLEPRLKHQPADVLGNPDVGFARGDLAGDAPLESGHYIARGVMARTENNRGLFAEEITSELVSLWQYSEAGGWQQLGSQETGTFADGNPGQYAIDTGSGFPPADFVVLYAVLNAEPSCGAHYMFAMPTGRQVVVTDIDGTLTESDDEIVTQVSDGNYDPLEKASASAVMRAWFAKGYPVIYLTARPHLLRSESRAWLDAHDFPPGAMITATDFVFDESARVYKGAWVKRIRNDLGWDVVAAYGNADSDIQAYEDAGIDKAVTFIIGPSAGANGTQAIEGDDFSAHLSDYVMQQPDASR